MTQPETIQFTSLADSTILPPASKSAPITLEPLAVLIARLVPCQVGLIPVPVRANHNPFSATIPA